MQKIAVIDDDPDMLRMVVRMLKSGGYECLAYTAASEAMASFGETGVDAILTDVQMPGASVSDVIAAARSARPGIPIIVMSGGRFAKSEAAANVDGDVDGVLNKPFMRQELLATMSRVLQAA